MIPIAIAVALAVIALVFVIAPLVSGKSKRGNGEGTSARAPSARPKLAGTVESALPDPFEELELDRAMGKISAAEFERLRTAMVARPERPVQPASPGAFDDEAESLIRAARRDLVTCATCGDRPEPGARFCSTCGKPLRGCAACGAPVEDDEARFCANCGAPLAG